MTRRGPATASAATTTEPTRAYELSLGDTDWKVANVLWYHGDFDEMHASGTYTFHGNNLVFKIEKYEFLDGSHEKGSNTLYRGERREDLHRLRCAGEGL
jgi:hypothetical protein